ncbi:MAG: short chain dehydrogenase [Bacteroidetes bacterium]|nr:MAG: short chain dehydrogenase [Bacteroidota bacterium]
MKILLVGGNGTIGRRLAEALRPEHELITAGRHSGDERVDISQPPSIARLFARLGTLDAVICTAGEARWERFESMSEADFQVGLRSKLMGQVLLTQQALQVLPPGGSITLSSGILADQPVDKTTSAAMVNGALHSFVRAAALELFDRRIRINVVCAGLVEDSYEKYKAFFPGHTPVPMRKVVDAYRRCLEGKIHGQVVRVWS